MTLCLVDDSLHVCSSYLGYAREICPLVSPRGKVVIEEHAVVLVPWSFLQWQGDQVPEPSLRHRVLTWKEAVVRIQTNIRSPLHRFGEDMRSEPSSQRGRNGFLEEEPDVRASSRA